MLLEFLQKNRLSRKILERIARRRAQDMINRIEKFFKKDDYILDLGSGSCTVSDILLKKEYNIVSLDIQNLSLVNNLSPIIYDGKNIPFKDNTFDKALIFTVLHHTQNPEEMLKKAKRVSKVIIIIEDIYLNWFHKYLTYFFDCLINLEFKGHPHTNKNDREWKEVFNGLGLKLSYAHYDNSFVIFRHATYYLTKD